MGRNVLLLSSFLVLSLWSTEARAFHPTRNRLLFHAARNLSEGVGISGHFVPSGNLKSPLMPYTYIGLDVDVASWLTLSPVVGWAFGPDHAITAAWVYAHYDRYWFFGHFETRPQSWFYYVVTQAQVNIWDEWLVAGLEQETWGYAEKSGSLDVGGGPNLLIRLGKARLDLAVHFRDKPDHGLEGELNFRFHIYL
jgi:hypothetical protein